MLGTGHRPRRIAAGLQRSQSGGRRTWVLSAVTTVELHEFPLAASRAARSQHTQSLVRRKVYISFTPIDPPPMGSSKGSAGRSPSQDKTAFLSWMAVLDGFHGMPEHAKKAVGVVNEPARPSMRSSRKSKKHAFVTSPGAPTPNPLTIVDTQEQRRLRKSF